MASSVPLDAVGDDGVAAQLEGVVAVLEGHVQMIQGVFPGPHVQGGAVADEGLAAPGLDVFHQRPGIIRPQEGQVALFAKVHLDGHKLALKVHLIQARFFGQTNHFSGNGFVADTRISVK